MSVHHDHREFSTFIYCLWIKTVVKYFVAVSMISILFVVCFFRIVKFHLYGIGFPPVFPSVIDWIYCTTFSESEES